ncbi:MAG: MarR family transcriptional regulator [Proteobacteria bacterium]|nr:MarR family transcriptional regulator [Pseudomonadota bacterium]
MVQTQIDRVEQGLARVKSRLPATPVEEILLSRLIVVLGREYSALFDRLLRPRGLTEPDFRVLTMIFSHADGTAFPSDLCSSMAQSPANITRITDILVERDLITRESSESDRRRMVLRITPRGAALLHECLPQTSELAKRVFSCLSRAEIRSVIEQLKRVAVSLDDQALDTQADARGTI